MVQDRRLALSRCSAAAFIRKSSMGWSAAACWIDTRTKCSTPAASAASMRLTLPSRSIAFTPRAPSPPKPLIAEMTVRTPTIARRSVSGCWTSPIAVSIPGSASCGLGRPPLVRTRIGSPWPARSGMSERPSIPVPPATRIIAAPPVPSTIRQTRSVEPLRLPRDRLRRRAPCRNGPRPRGNP